jgi:hypothetical protein
VHRGGDQRSHEFHRPTVGQHFLFRKDGGDRFEAQVASEGRAEVCNQVGSAEHFRPGQHVRVVVTVVVIVPEKQGYGRIGDVTLVHHRGWSDVGSGDNVTSAQLRYPAADVRRQSVAAEYERPQTRTVQQAFHVSVHLHDRIRLVNAIIVNG